MNKRQKEILQAQLNNEKQVLKELKQVYQQAIKDCSLNISQLSTRTDMENIQTIVYQQQYQQAIKAQLETALAQLQSGEFATISDYLARSYNNGYIGVMYDLAGQGIPLVVPIDTKAVLQAIQIDSKLSKSLYDRLGEDVKKLKTSVRAEVSRGIANGSSWNEIGDKISLGMNSTIDMFGFNKAKNNAIRIARTESHRIQNQSALDAQHEAKKKGANVVKMWDSALDGNTRPAHAQADGQIRELDEYFDVGGEKMKAPGVGGSAANVVNCRCALLQRARWALDEEELNTLKERAEYFGLDKTKDFEEYKEKYLKASERVREGAQKMNYNVIDNEKQLQKYSDDLLGKHGISVDLSDVDNVIKEAKENVDNLDKLLSEYNSTLKNFVIKKGSVSNEGGSTYWLTDTITGMKVIPKNIKNIKAIEDTLGVGDNKHLVTVTHEFAHTLSSYSRKIDTDFWKEINSIKREYKKELGYIEMGKSKYTKDKIFISNYAEKNADEFLAEAFAQAKLSDNPSPYAVKVLDVVDKYFKKVPLEKASKSGTIISGAVSGARNPFGEKAKEHAQKYYGLVRSMKTDVAKISKTTGIDEKDIQDIKNFIFLEKHDLGGKELEYFEPDYMMAESWQRLIEGKPETHDITMLKHEVLEKELMQKGMTQEQSHIEASKKYNYSKEAGEYYAKIEKYKKE